MSRNKEKAQSALNRFQQEVSRQAGVLESNPNLRPKYVQSVKSLPQAEKWRSVVISLISTNLTRIQDAMLDESTIRELNETINKLLKEKKAWEHHIKSLGGPDFLRFGPNLESTGLVDDFSGNKGYRYFGRAKDLPEVKMLKQAKEDKANRESTKRDNQINKAKELEQRFSNIDPHYYLLFNNTQSETNVNKICEAFGEEFNTKIGDTQTIVDEYDLKSISKKLYQDLPISEKEESYSENIDNIQNFSLFIPEEDVIKEYVINRKKSELLGKFSS